MQKINWKENSKNVLDLIGGKENIDEFAHCATRLRFTLKDDSLLKLDDLKKLNFVKGYNKQDNQHQLIIGAGVVDKIYKELDLIINSNLNNSDFKIKNKKKLWNKEFSLKSNLLLISKRGMNSFASIFVPLVPIFMF